MKFGATTLILSSLIAISAMCSSVSAQTIHRVWQPPYQNGIIAVVEDRVITMDEIRRQMVPLVPQVRASSRNDREFDRNMEGLYLEVLQSLIDRTLIVKDFRKQNFQIPPNLVDQEINRILIEDFNNDRVQFLDALSQQGKTLRDFRKDVEERMIVSIMRNRMRRSQSEISPERIESYYNANRDSFFRKESVKLRIILLRPFADEGEEVLKQTAEKVLAELRSGKNFADLAREYSQDTRRSQGGDWGWIERGDLRAELDAKAFELSKGSYSEPIRIGDQLFILYAEDRRAEGVPPVREVRGEIEERLVGEFAQEAQKRWLESLRRDGFVKYH